MSSFSVTPITNLPPATASAFPQNLQFQLNGVDVGTRGVDTVNFVSGATLNMTVGAGENANVLTITIPT